MIFDNYGNICREELLFNAEWSIETLFRLLGLEWASDGAKALAYKQVVKLLGMMMDISEISQGLIKVGQTPERVNELSEEIRSILEENSLDHKRAERLSIWSSLRAIPLDVCRMLQFAVSSKGLGAGDGSTPCLQRSWMH